LVGKIGRAKSFSVFLVVRAEKIASNFNTACYSASVDREWGRGDYLHILAVLES
jgi:hypothetical protein